MTTGAEDRCLRSTEKERTMDMIEDLDKIFCRQFKRLEAELLSVNIPTGYLTIISKYWDFCKEDVLTRIKDNGDDKSSQFNK